MKHETWNNVTSQSPCPVCGKPDWCSISTDGSAVNCRRKSKVAQSAVWKFKIKKTDDNGEVYYQWIKPDSSGGTTEAIDPANTSIVDHVYQLVLTAAPLHRTPWQQLQRRGLTRRQIRLRIYGYLNDRSRKSIIKAVLAAGLMHQLELVPGFYKKDGKWSFAGPNGILVPVRNQQGQIIAFKIRTDKPSGSNKYVYVSSKKHNGRGPGSPIHVPLMADSKDHDEIRITEGELKADVTTALSDVLTLGLPGVQSFRKVEPILNELKPKRILISFDADFRTNPVVAKALVNTVRQLEQQYPVYVETWPAGAGKGIDDLLATARIPQQRSGKSLAKLLRWIERKFGKINDDGGERPTILVNTEEQSVNDRAIVALTNDETIYKRGGVLVHVLCDDSKPKGIERAEAAPRIAALQPATLRERLAKAGSWIQAGSNGDPKPVHPPEWAVQSILHRGTWDGIRPLEAIITGPTIRANGTVLSEPGYDHETGLLCILNVDVPEVPHQPSAKQLKQAVEVLREAVVDFPFASETYFAVWVSFLLTIVSRFAFKGSAPIFVVDANTQGSGKGLLVDVASMIATGHRAARMVNPEDDAEARKRITAQILAGDQLILIDNVSGTLGTPALDAVLTADTWKDRILGRSEMVELPVLATWAATGNNITLTRDMTRRVAHIRLSSPLERPEERSGFAHPNLLTWVKRKRGRLLNAALTILRGYCAAGRPRQNFSPWGSFEGWSNLVRSAVVSAGLADPGLARQELASRGDLENQALGALLTGLQLHDPKGAGVTASELLKFLADTKNKNSKAAELVEEALGELCPSRNGALSPNSLGKRLFAFLGRVVGGRCLDKRLKNKTSVWFVRKSTDINEPKKGDKGDTGGKSAPTCEPKKTKEKKKKTKGSGTKNNSPISSISLPANSEVI